jgi:hypothetical protein
MRVRLGAQNLQIADEFRVERPANVAPVLPAGRSIHMAAILLSTSPMSSSTPSRPDRLKGEPSEMKVNWIRSPGMLLLAIWLILMNLVPLVPLIASLGVLLNVLGVAAGVLILIGR